MRKLLEFRRSPNCVKVRLGLKLKKLDFETEEMSAADRAPLVEASGWPLVPVLIDGDVRMRESEAILHYLDANYRNAPSLALENPDAHKMAERTDREMQAAMIPLTPLVRGLMQVPPAERDADEIRALHEACDRIVEPLEERLADGAYLFGDRPTLYDITCACRVMPMRPPKSFLDDSEMWRNFNGMFRLADRFERVRKWHDELVALDGLTPA